MEIMIRGQVQNRAFSRRFLFCFLRPLRFLRDLCGKLWFWLSSCSFVSSASVKIFSVCNDFLPSLPGLVSPCFSPCLRASVVGFGFWLWLRHAVVKNIFG